MHKIYTLEEGNKVKFPMGVWQVHKGRQHCKCNWNVAEKRRISDDSSATGDVDRLSMADASSR